MAVTGRRGVDSPWGSLCVCASAMQSIRPFAALSEGNSVVAPAPKARAKTAHPSNGRLRRNPQTSAFPPQTADRLGAYARARVVREVAEG